MSASKVGHGRQQLTHLPTHIPGRQPGPPSIRRAPAADPTRPWPVRRATSSAADVASLVQQPTGSRSAPVEAASREAGRVAGAATRRPTAIVEGAGGELPPSCLEPLKSLQLYLAETELPPLPDPPVRDPPPPAASPCASVRGRRPQIGAAPPRPQTQDESVGTGGWGGGDHPVSRICRTCRPL